MNMKMNFLESDGEKFAEILSDRVLLNSTQDVLDMMADADYGGARKIIVHEKNISPEFFKLSTNLAGEILQKFVNYKVSLAIVGDFSKYNSKPLNDFIRECNRGRQIFFVNDVESAVNELKK